MRHGRIIRVSERQGYATYIVAEEDATKAEALMRTVVGPKPVVQTDRTGLGASCFSYSLIEAAISARFRFSV